MQILEQFIQSKKGDMDSSEDMIIFNQHYAGIVDGATSRSGILYNNKTPGYWAARLIKETVEAEEPDLGLEKLIKSINNAINTFYKQNNIDTATKEKLSASAIIYSKSHNQIWMIGDCQCLVGNTAYTNNKKIDDLISDFRSYYLQSELARGKTIEQLLANDTSGDLVSDLLIRQHCFQNDILNSEFSYSAIDGADFPVSDVKIIKPNYSDSIIIMASDGYPVLKHTLEQTEKYLQKIIAIDPLFIYKYKSVKGIKPGNVSYDDRAYLKVQIK